MTPVMKSERIKKFRMRLESLLDDYGDVVYKELADIISNIAELVEKINKCN